jgi:P27 family predicted phage terminase small subunit
MRGRKPKPTVLKIARGNPGKRRLNEHEATPEVKVPPAPDELDEIAKKEWARMSTLLLQHGLLTELDRAAFAGYCVSWSQWTQAMEKVQQLGPIIKAPSGFPIQNPYLAVANHALKTMQGLLVEFGMTPASRSRVHASNGAASPDAARKARFFGKQA